MVSFDPFQFCQEDTRHTDNKTEHFRSQVAMGQVSSNADVNPKSEQVSINTVSPDNNEKRGSYISNKGVEYE